MVLTRLVSSIPKALSSLATLCRRNLMSIFTVSSEDVRRNGLSRSARRRSGRTDLSGTSRSGSSSSSIAKLAMASSSSLRALKLSSSALNFVKSIVILSEIARCLFPISLFLTPHCVQRWSARCLWRCCRPVQPAHCRSSCNCRRPWRSSYLSRIGRRRRKLTHLALDAPGLIERDFGSCICRRSVL